MEPSIKSYLPSKKFIITVGIIAFLVILGFVISGIIKRQQAKNRLTDVTLGGIAQQDLDKNGVPDWQDNLYRLGIGKLTSGENAQFGQYGTAGESGQNNQTAQLAQDMYIAISSLSKNGTIDPVVQKNLTEMLSSYIQTVNEPRVWTREDIKIAGNDTAAINQYVSEYSIFVELYKPPTTPIPMLQSAIELDDPYGLQQSLAGPITMHKDALDGLQSMTVPEKVIPYHLAIMNGIQGILTDTEAMSQYFTDPLLTFSAVLRYNEDAQTFVDAIRAHNNNFLLPFVENPPR